MEKRNLNELRDLFLKFFEEKDHIVMHSFPLIPQEDKSLLLINAGMAPLKKYFTGEKKFAKDRVATSQKCIRTQDIENVGRTQRHAAFFEMLGNFSFGDYFKKEAIAWAMEFLVDWLHIDKNLLWATVYEEDDEAFELWQTVGGLPIERIERMGKDTNFWELELGPCGPCSEIFVDRGEKYSAGDWDTSPAADGDRFIEVWNLVFTQFDRQPDGSYIPLPKPNIDTGMGLERLNLVTEEADNIFETEALQDLMQTIQRVTNKTYKVHEKDDVSIRVLCDHSKAMTFLIGDGVLPSNEGRGYVLRRLMRRALRHGMLLGMKGLFLTQICEAVIRLYQDAYPELVERRDLIFRIIEAEEEKFQKTIHQGMEILHEEMDQMQKAGVTQMSGEAAFKLYDTYGFPPDLTREELEEKGFTIDEVAFEAQMQEQRARSKAHGMQGSIGWESGHNEQIMKLPKTEFLGYKDLTTEAGIVHIFQGEHELSELEAGSEGIVIADRTPFYGEGGGQVGDKGLLWTDYGQAEVIDTKKTPSGAVLHIVRVSEGTLTKGEKATLVVDSTRRSSTKKNHSATHLLHKALRMVLGNHIEQAGSYVDDHRLRFDFTHFEAISADDLQAIEKIVNEKIAEALPVTATEMNLNEATARGAIGLFEDKYQDVVRVLEMGDFSKELCGGTHVDNTAQIQMFHILSESSVSAGIRRIEAITGFGVYELLRKQQETLGTLASMLKSQPQDLVEKTEGVLQDNRNKQKEIQKLMLSQNADRVGQIIGSKQEVNGIPFVTGSADDMSTDQLRDLADRVRDQLGTGVVVLAGKNADKVQFVVAASKDLVSQKRVHAGNIVREVAKLADGNGGGRPDMATAGGKSADKTDFALQSVYDIIKGQSV